MGLRLSLPAGAIALSLAALLFGAPGAFAQAPGETPQEIFQRGVELYERGDYDASAEAFARSYELDPNPEALFAWAQSARQSGDCEKAIELYRRLLDEVDLPEANVAAVQLSIEECQAELDAAAREPADPAGESGGAPAGEAPGAPEASASPAGPAPEGRPSEGRPWYADPVGGALVGSGVLGIGFGVGFLISASSADGAKSDAENYQEFVSRRDRAESHGRIGVLATATGAALVGAGVVWYLTRPEEAERSGVSAWLGSGAGGITVRGRF